MYSYFIWYLYCPSENINNQFKVVVGGLIHQNQKILICQRKDNGEHRLKWEFPGGKLKDYETNQGL